MSNSPFVALHGASSSLVLDCRGNAPAIMYWGKRLRGDTDYAALAQVNARQEPPASAANEPAVTLSPSLGEGFTGQVGLNVHRGSQGWGVFTEIRDVSVSGNESVSILSEDSRSGLCVTHVIKMDSATDVIEAYTHIENIGATDLNVDWCAAPTFAIAPKYQDITSFEGRWAKEFQLQRHGRVNGTFLRENRRGRTSHDSFPALVLSTEQANDTHGETLAFHLGWSGNHRLCVEELHDGRVLAQMGELLFPGEIILGQHQTYQSPSVYAAYSGSGLNGISKRFHAYVRNHLLSEQVKSKPRPVHFNTWEALYFDHNQEALFALVDEAAAVGAERYILDDGWFNGRRGEAAGLGDWYVDENVYPNGLKPLIDKVISSGMEFGLWFEPEMVNPDSDLYRAHPDWVLQVPSATKVMTRNQLVLDLTNSDVCDYLFERIDSLLSEYEISYVKWDMNRDVNQPGNIEGHPAIHMQTLALYQLIDKVRAAHPGVEIESCASGGGRADFGILARTDRVWTSDSNDALDRLSIQRGFSLFFPPEIMGAHVGPYDCHITGRKLDIATRASTALFGHMGMEVNLLEMEADEKQVLQAAIALHKTHRSLIHSGEVLRFKSNTYSDSFAILDPGAATGLYAYTDIAGHTRSQASHYYFVGLDASAQYSIEVIWPLDVDTQWTQRFSGTIFGGDVLLENGIQLPLIHPETSLVFRVEKTA